MGIRIQEASFDPGAELNAFSELTEGAGAIVTFTGLVRSTPGDGISTLTLECYPELALNQIGEMVAQAHTRFALLDEVVIHRYGTLNPGEPIVQVMTLAPHRQAAFDAAQFLMDYLKTDAPFWKKEATEAGERWVEARGADDEARARWSD
jgi:molybdopterin synthase catalytic subunit